MTHSSTFCTPFAARTHSAVGMVTLDALGPVHTCVGGLLTSASIHHTPVVASETAKNSEIGPQNRKAAITQNLARAIMPDLVESKAQETPYLPICGLSRSPAGAPRGEHVELAVE